MPITRKQRELRRKHLGSSDMSALFGLDPYRTAYDVWLEKTDQLEEKPQENESMYAGTIFEDGVLRFATEALGPLVRNQYRSAENLPIGANIDAIVKESGEPVEAKTAGLFGPLMEPWGEINTDEVPPRVVIQAHVHMLCTEQDVCHVAAFLGGRGFLLYCVPRDTDIVDIIAARATDFWRCNVETVTPPEDCLPSVDLLKRVRREPESTVDISDELVQGWLKAKEQEKAAKQDRKQAERALLAALQNAEAGRSASGLVTFYEQHRKSYTVKESTYRVLRYKKGEKNG